MRRIFTKRFFELSAIDQAAVVDATIRNIESCIGRHINPVGDKKAKEQIKRILARAAEYGIVRDDVTNTGSCEQKGATE